MKDDKNLAENLKKSIKSFAHLRHPLPGIENEAKCNTLCKQVVSSIHRIKYIHRIRERDISELRVSPFSESFDPLKAAIFHHRLGDIDEAFWLVFLSVHFGKHSKDGWRLVRDIYGRLGEKKNWDWSKISPRPQNFRKWLEKNSDTLKNGVPRRFGNHRKYESLDAWSDAGTGSIIETYISWIKSFGTHQNLVKTAKDNSNNNPGDMFEYLYKSMEAVHRFGRTARFDYLTMLGKLGFVEIEPKSVYLKGSTGPLKGARLLFGGNINADLSPFELEQHLIELGDYIGVGMQVLEDSLCNWQKKPDSFAAFRG
jgi:hypothetical protein